MGWANTLKNSAIKFLGKHGIGLARRAGKAYLPNFTKKVEGFYVRHKNIIDGIGGIAQSVSDVAGNVGTGDIEGGIRSVAKGIRSGKQLVKGIREGRGAPGNRGRREKRKPEGGASASTEGGGAQPRLSGDALARMTKLART